MAVTYQTPAPEGGSFPFAGYDLAHRHQRGRASGRIVNPAKPHWFADPMLLADTLIERLDRRIVLALPLGLGKANHLANALYARAAADPSLSLTILTALTLEAPIARSELARRLLEPMAERFYAHYPPLAYATALRQGTLPDNIRVQEFFLAPGRWLNHPQAQQSYQCANYTQVLELLIDQGVNLIGQLVAPPPDPQGERVSLSCNPDLSVDLLQARAAGRIDFLAVAQVNHALPYMGGEAACPLTNFDYLLEDPALEFPLFGLPQRPVSLQDHAIGLQVARLIKDGGTLQIGIGSIGDAICHALILRHTDNPAFVQLLQGLAIDPQGPLCWHRPLHQGLYGLSEMLVEGFLTLIEQGVLKREVDGVLLHAGFFLGSPRFYRTLNEWPARQRHKIAMMPISFVNQLYPDSSAKRNARSDARFVNSAMLATLLGAVVSDGLADGQVVSGVGGQYNFAAMAQELPGARSIITLPATRTRHGRRQSNICWNYPHTTLPRHLRDLLVTEYGVADLRGQCDAEVIARVLAITDSEFQPALLAQAQAAGKIARDYPIPSAQRNNTPQRLQAALGDARRQGLLPPFPLGSDYSAAEERLVPALHHLGEQAGSLLAMARLLWRGQQRHGPDAEQSACLARMGLSQPRGWRERLYRRLLLAVLE